MPRIPPDGKEVFLAQIGRPRSSEHWEEADRLADNTGFPDEMCSIIIECTDPVEPGLLAETLRFLQVKDMFDYCRFGQTDFTGPPRDNWIEVLTAIHALKCPPASASQRISQLGRFHAMAQPYRQYTRAEKRGKIAFDVPGLPPRKQVRFRRPSADFPTESDDDIPLFNPPKRQCIESELAETKKFRCIVS